MKATEIRELSPEEMRKQLRDARNELVHMRLQHSMGQLENTAQLKSTRRDIARMETILLEKERAVAKAEAMPVEA